MRAINTVDNNELASDLVLAASLLSRMRGLIGRKELADGKGLWIKPCKGVHTFGMRFPIDVVFLDQEQRVISVARSLPPNRLTRIYIDAASVLELPSGSSGTTDAGDLIRIN